MFPLLASPIWAQFCEDESNLIQFFYRGRTEEKREKFEKMGSNTLVGEEVEAGVEWSSEAVLYVNGVRRVLPDGMAHVTLLQYLRGSLSSIFFLKKFNWFFKILETYSYETVILN